MRTASAPRVLHLSLRSQHRRKVDVDRVAAQAARFRGGRLPRVQVHVLRSGQELIQKDIREERLDRVVVASCSPLLHEHTFRKAVEKAGLNPFHFQMVNIRENVSWVHDDPEEATLKAIDLARAALRRVRLHRALEQKRVPVTPAVLVVGGGIAGIHAALTLADAGKKVYLVEREPTIGGHMAKFDKTFPTLDCAACILTRRCRPSAPIRTSRSGPTRRWSRSTASSGTTTSR